MVTWSRFVLSMRMVSPLGLVNRSGVSVHAYSMNVSVAFSLSSCAFALAGAAAKMVAITTAHAQPLPAHFMIRIS